MTDAQLGVDRCGEIVVHRDGLNILWETLFQCLAAKPGAHQYAPATGVEGRLEVVRLVTHERGFGWVRPVTSEGLAQHTARRLAPRRLVIVSAAQDQIDFGVPGRQHLFEGYMNRVELYLR
jgi:hypothetical protein